MSFKVTVEVPRVTVVVLGVVVIAGLAGLTDDPARPSALFSLDGVVIAVAASSWRPTGTCPSASPSVGTYGRRRACTTAAGRPATVSVSPPSRR